MMKMLMDYYVLKISNVILNYFLLGGSQVSQELEVFQETQQEY